MELAATATKAVKVDLKTYLGDVLGREQALFTAKRIKQEILDNMAAVSALHETVVLPDSTPEETFNYGVFGWIWICWLALVFPVGCMIAGPLYGSHKVSSFFGAWGSVIGIGFIAAAILSVIVAINEFSRVENFNTGLKKREASAQADYDAKMRTVKAEQKTSLAALGEKRIAADRFIAETRDALNALYALDIVYGKYRYFVAVASFCEYIQSGRCDSLDGHEGAYNLYENELRQNIIIGQIEVATQELREIRRGQYMLFEAITETNSTLQDLTAEISGLRGEVGAAAKSSAMTAYFAKETANNTRLLVDVERDVYGNLKNKGGKIVF